MAYVTAAPKFSSPALHAMSPILSPRFPSNPPMLQAATASHLSPRMVSGPATTFRPATRVAAPAAQPPTHTRAPITYAASPATTYAASPCSATSPRSAAQITYAASPTSPRQAAPVTTYPAAMHVAPFHPPGYVSQLPKTTRRVGFGADVHPHDGARCSQCIPEKQIFKQQATYFFGEVQKMKNRGQYRARTRVDPVTGYQPGAQSENVDIWSKDLNTRATVVHRASLESAIAGATQDIIGSSLVVAPEDNARLTVPFVAGDDDDPASARSSRLS